MANTFDMVNNALMRSLEKLDELDPSSDEGKAEIERAKAVKDTCMAAVANANATVAAMGAIHSISGTAIPTPALLGGGE